MIGVSASPCSQVDAITFSRLDDQAFSVRTKPPPKANSHPAGTIGDLLTWSSDTNATRSALFSKSETNCAHTCGSYTKPLLTTLRIGFFAHNPRLTHVWDLMVCAPKYLSNTKSTLARLENVWEFYLFTGEKKRMFLSTMRVDTYFLPSSAPRVFAVRRASSMSYVATSFVVRDNKWPEASSVLTSSKAANFGQKICCDFIFWLSGQKTILASCERFVFNSDDEQILCCFRNNSPLSRCDAEAISCTVSFGDTNNAVWQLT